ncbi:MAG: cation diffusion facilitator family transporter [Azospirillaceae bacterium]
MTTAETGGEPGNPRLRRAAALASVAVALTLSAAKLFAWLATGSVTILSSLLDSLVDLAASTLTLLAVTHAQRPPDRSHRYGHGKAEPLGALAQAAFILGSAAFLSFEAIARLAEPAPIAATGIGIAVMVGAIVLTLALVGFQLYVVRTTGSLAIDADSLHYRGDLAIAVGVILTLLVAERYPWVDPVVAMAIAAYLLHSAWKIGRSSLDVLMDRELPQGDRARIKAIVLADDRVRGLHDLRTRSSGTQAFIELHLELDGALSLAVAHRIADDVEDALKAAFPGAEVAVHQEPAGLEDERLDDRIAEGRG